MLGKAHADCCSLIEQYQPDRTIMQGMPKQLVWEKRCLDAGLVHGWSDLVPSTKGLYPTKHFFKGETIISGTATSGRWIIGEEAVADGFD